MSARAFRLAAGALGLLAAAGCRVSEDDSNIMPPVHGGQVLRAEPGWEPAVPLNGWHYIIIHHSATVGGSAEIFEKFHREVRHFENGMAYHFVIGNGVDVADGLVEVGERWKRQLQGAHVGGELNKEAIGICLVGDFSQNQPTARQLAALDRLLRFLQARCRIPTALVLGHREVRPGYTVCPGQNFSMDKLRISLSVGSPVCQLPAEPEAAAPAGSPGVRIYGPVRRIR
jgi:hypothetical protein